MRLPAPPSRPAREPIGPLVDVVFLLLVFFLLAGTLEPAPPLRVEPPRSQQARPETGERGVLTLLLDGEGRVGFDGQVVDPGEVAARLAAPLAEQPGRPVRLVADAGAASGVVLTLLAELRRLGAGEIALATRPAVSAGGLDD
jgi:biopolymer transport protein ExbD